MAAVSRADVLAVLGTLTPQELYELGMGGRPQGPSSDTPKLSVPCDRVAEADIPKVVEACRAGIRHAAEGGSDADAAHFLAQVNPALASEAVRNSTHRRKPVIHSLRVIAEYLQSPQAAEKRAAAKLRVPPSRTGIVRRPTATAPQGTFLVPHQEQPAVTPAAPEGQQAEGEEGADQ